MTHCVSERCQKRVDWGGSAEKHPPEAGTSLALIAVMSSVESGVKPGGLS